jgi:hypothetical protein
MTSLRGGFVLRNKKQNQMMNEVCCGHTYLVKSLLCCNGVYFGGISTFQRNMSLACSGSNINPSKEPAKLIMLPSLLVYSLVSFFNPEDGSDMFLRNVGLSTNHVTLQRRGTYSSELQP